MEFEWDKNKNQSNIHKHGISFSTASKIFQNENLLTKVDDRFDYGEVREISIGKVEEDLLITVTHTNRSGITRIISARKASNKERNIYYSKLLEKTKDSDFER